MNIQITDTADYAGQDMAWTEKMKNVVLKKGSSYIHYSPTKIKTFYPKVTCFFSEGGPEEHAYQITLLSDIQGFESVHGEEVRIDLEKYQDQVVIEYLGKKVLVDTGITEKTYSNCEGWKEKPVYKTVYK
jgi:hypothetical protein